MNAERIDDANQVPKPARLSPARPLPVSLQLARKGLNALGRIAPRAAGRLTFGLFCTPLRYPEPPREARVLRQAERFSVPFRDVQLAAYAWGEGPTVLLVHGWSGRGSQLGAFMPPLVAAGHRVVAFDLPAHGRTPGRRTNAYVTTEAVRRVGEAVGALRGVIAHSFGALNATLALRDGLAAERVVYLAPACRASQAIRGFARQFGLSWAVEWGLRDEMERRFGPGVWHQVSALDCARDLAVPALIVHDLDDAEVPYREGQMLAHSWPGARLIATAGLGHRRLLRDERIVEQAIEFLLAASVRSASAA